VAPRGDVHLAADRCLHLSGSDVPNSAETALSRLRESFRLGPLRSRALAVREYLAGPRGDAEADVVGLLLALGGERASSTLGAPGAEWRGYERCLGIVLEARESRGTNGELPLNDASHERAPVCCMSHLFDLIERLADEMRGPI
jgi:hypothetical protein